jgi:hypothetical protein
MIPPATLTCGGFEGVLPEAVVGRGWRAPMRDSPP